MEHAVTVALSQQMALRRSMDVIASNIANINTPSYKSETPVFAEFLMPGAQAYDNGKPVGSNTISYVVDKGLHRDFTDGEFMTTSNPLDVAISGDGFFTVQTPDGDRYTRNGHFQIDNLGQLVTSQGDPVMSIAGGPILIDTEAGEISISQDGMISNSEGDIGQLAVVNFEDPQKLQKEGNSYYESPDEAPQPVLDPVLVQGMLEGSNIQGVVEMARMIDVTRAYQASQRAIEKVGEMSRSAIRQLGSNPQ